MSAYLDNTVVSALGRGEDVDALERIADAFDNGRVQLVTSQVTLDEINRIPAEHRDSFTRIKQVYEILAKVPVAPLDHLVGIRSWGDERTWINQPIIARDPLYADLLSLGLEGIDALHVFVAAKAGCAEFISCDRHHVNRAHKIKELCGISVFRPTGFCEANQL